MAENFIQKMMKSDNRLLKAQAASIQKWSKLRHTRGDLETILGYNIVTLRYKAKGEKEFSVITCTSNKRLINVYNAVKKEEKLKQMNTEFTGLKTPDKDAKLGYVFTYDLIEGKPKTIPVWTWEIAMPFISIEEDYVLTLTQLLNDYLRK